MYNIQGTKIQFYCSNFIRKCIRHSSQSVNKKKVTLVEEQGKKLNVLHLYFSNNALSKN